MKNQIFILTFLLKLSVFASAQQSGFTVIALDIKNQITYDDVWNLNIITSAPHTFEEFYLKVNIYTYDKELLIRAVTGNFDLSQGVFSINNFNYKTILSPKIEFRSGAGYYSMLDAGGFFPAGKYILEYELYGISVDPVGSYVHEKVSAYAMEKHIEIFFPVMLLEPADVSEFTQEKIKSVFFAWTPAMVMDRQSEVLYQLEVYEVLKGQTPEQAVNSRNPFFAEKRIKATFFNYPAYARNFADDTRYAWRILTYINSNFAATSEIWSFTYGSEALPENQCDFFKADFIKTFQGNIGCYKLLITNNYTGKSTKYEPKSFKIKVENDSVFSITGGVSDGWTRAPEKIPPHTIDVKWINKTGYIPKGETDLGFIYLGDTTTNPVYLIYEWLNKDEKVICKDSCTIIYEMNYYYDLSKELSDNYIEVSDNPAYAGLNIQFFNNYASVENIIFNIYDAESQALVSPKIKKNIKLNSINGLNRISINLKDYGLLSERTYLLTVSDYMNNYYLNFKITQQQK